MLDRLSPKSFIKNKIIKTENTNKNQTNQTIDNKTKRARLCPITIISIALLIRVNTCKYKGKEKQKEQDRLRSPRQRRTYCRSSGFSNNRSQRYHFPQVPTFNSCRNENPDNYRSDRGILYENRRSYLLSS